MYTNEQNTPPKRVYVYWCRDCKRLLLVSHSRYEHGERVICFGCHEKGHSVTVDEYEATGRALG